jgi:IMP dehydrogenase
MKLTFDDISIVPKYSEVFTRSDCDTSNKIGNIELGTPLIASPMDTVCGPVMARRMHELGGIGILHRFCHEIEFHSNANELESVIPQRNCQFGLAVGVNNPTKIRRTLESTNPTLICIDVAHGHHKLVKDTISYIKDINEDIHVMAGSICTGEAAEDLLSWGADSLRVGVGNGSMCETRIRAGVGIPQVNAIIDCSIGINHEIPIIADGGIRTTGDVAKALAIGADAVMIGSLFAGTKESPGHIQKMGMWPNEQLYKKYQGSASLDSKIARGETNNVEGNSRIIPYKGKVKRIVDDINDGLRSCMSYVGANNIRELQKNATFIRVSQAGQIEAKPHGLI